MDFPIIDVHAHTFPQNVFEKIWAYFGQHHWSIYYRTAEAERARFLDTHTERYTTLCYAHKPGMAAWLNDYVLQYVPAHPKAIAMGTFHPDDADILAYVESGIKRGLKGFKMHLEVQRFNPADPRLEKVYDLLTESGMIVAVHTAGDPLEGPWTGPEHFECMLKMAPKLPMIVAHMGGSKFRDYWRYAGSHPLYFDTAMVGVTMPGAEAMLADPAMLETVRGNIDCVLFGSDFPSIPFPWQHQVDVVRGWRLGAEAEAKVFYGNAKRLFRL